jgi:hypothetical protein
MGTDEEDLGDGECSNEEEFGNGECSDEEEFGILLLTLFLNVAHQKTCRVQGAFNRNFELLTHASLIHMLQGAQEHFSIHLQPCNLILIQ